MPQQITWFYAGHATSSIAQTLLLFAFAIFVRRAFSQTFLAQQCCLFLITWAIWWWRISWIFINSSIIVDFRWIFVFVKIVIIVFIGNIGYSWYRNHCRRKGKQKLNNGAHGKRKNETLAQLIKNWQLFIFISCFVKIAESSGAGMIMYSFFLHISHLSYHINGHTHIRILAHHIRNFSFFLVHSMCAWTMYSGRRMSCGDAFAAVGALFLLLVSTKLTPLKKNGCHQNHPPAK